MRDPAGACRDRTPASPGPRSCARRGRTRPTRHRPRSQATAATAAPTPSTTICVPDTLAAARRRAPRPGAGRIAFSGRFEQRAYQPRAARDGCRARADQRRHRVRRQARKRDKAATDKAPTDKAAKAPAARHDHQCGPPRGRRTPTHEGDRMTCRRDDRRERIVSAVRTARTTGHASTSTPRPATTSAADVSAALQPRVRLLPRPAPTQDALHSGAHGAPAHRPLRRGARARHGDRPPLRAMASRALVSLTA